MHINIWIVLKDLMKQNFLTKKTTDKDISDKDYEHGLKILIGFEIINMGEYHDLYLKTHAFSLTVIFEEFKSISTEH